MAAPYEISECPESLHQSEHLALLDVPRKLIFRERTAIELQQFETFSEMGGSDVASLTEHRAPVSGVS